MSGTISSQLPSFRPQSIQSTSCHIDDQSDSDLSDTPIVMDSITPVSALRNPYDWLIQIVTLDVVASGFFYNYGSNSHGFSAHNNVLESGA